MGGRDALPPVRQRRVRPQPLPSSPGQRMNARALPRHHRPLSGAPRRGRRRLLPRPLPGDRPGAGRDVDRDRPAGPQRRRASAAQPGRGGDDPQQPRRARRRRDPSPSASAATTARATSCAAGSGGAARRAASTTSSPHPTRRTFTYCKPLVIEPGRPPRRAEPARLEELDADARRARRSAWPTGCARSPPTSRRDHRARPGGPAPRRASSPAACSRPSASSPRRTPTCRSSPTSRRGLARLPAAGLQDERRRAGALLMSSASRRRPLGEPRLPGGRQGDRGATGRPNGRPVFVTLAERGIVGAGARRGGRARPGPPRPRARSTSSAPATP